MRAIEAEDAEARFRELLTDVEKGAAIVVTRQGAPIARMTPTVATPARVASTIDDWERYCSEHNVVLGGGFTIRELIAEGRE